MEFCSQSLSSVLKDKPIVFERQPEEEMKVFEYYISCKIFKELLECVEYLHSSDPPIIHRDLKPDNILISANIGFNRIVKLCDFGLATDHNIDEQTAYRYEHSIVGTIAYMAPEVTSRSKYNHKSDIYSLSLIGQQLFAIDLQASESFNAKESVFKISQQCLYQTLAAMMSTPFWRQRPECRQVLATYNEWSIDRTVVTNHTAFKSI
ncbi:unnamed protein product, partial [Medioppia subpectinata]